MSKERILVVDDELDNRVMMRYFLESWGYEVDLAANGQEALEKVEANPPQMVLLDLEMPVMNGFETCDRLKSDQATEQIPVIMFTGLEQTADKVKGIRKGADDYVVKTVDPEELQARIEMILKRSKRFEAQQTANGNNGDQLHGSHAVAGSLSELYFPETMQLIMAYGKSGVLHLQDEDREGRVYLKEGRVVHAEIDNTEGEDAFYDLALWKSGHFRFQVGETPPRETINKSGTNLLIEATRRLDEWNMISSKIPSFDVSPCRIPLPGSESIRLTRQDWKILLLMDGNRSIREISAKLENDVFETGRIVFNLITVGVVSLEKQQMDQGETYDEVPSLEPELTKKGPFQFSVGQWKVITYIDGQRNVSTLANLSGIPAPMLVKVIKSLEEQGFVRIKQGATKANTPPRKASGGKMQEDDNPLEKVATKRPRIRAIGLD